MSSIPKILLVDDEQDFLDLFEDILSRLPSAPEIQTCKSGAAALALLDSEPFTLIITDLHMPEMDGLQMLLLVRRKYPNLRIVVMTALLDELERARAYELGADLFWQKPANRLDVDLFQNCIESLLNRAEGRARIPARMRPIEDVLNWEHAARRSGKVTFRQGKRMGTVWLSNGEWIDAEAGELKGEEALGEMLSWGAAEFATSKAEPRVQTIFQSAEDFLAGQELRRNGRLSEELPAALNGSHQESEPRPEVGSPRGVEFVHAVPERPLDGAAPEPSNPDQLAAWMLQTQEAFQELGFELGVGELKQLEVLGPDRHVAVAVLGDFTLCAGFNRALDVEQVRSTLKQIVKQWVL
jgi:CheY-like chemotaxis protein